MYQRAELPAKLAGVDACRAFFASCFDPSAERETLWVAHVDEQSTCLHLASYDSQETQQIDFPAKAILIDAALCGSAGVVLAHNHPSGDASPSPSDCQATRRLATAASALDVTVLDHLIFAGDDFTSMRRSGIL